MARSPAAIRNLPEPIRDQLLYYVAELAFEKKRSLRKIAEKMFKWVQDNVPEYLNPDGVVGDATVRHYIQDAIQKGFVRLRPFQVPGLVEDIRAKLESNYKDLSLENVKIYVAPRRDLMLRYVWDYLDEFLTNKLSAKRPAAERPDKVVVGVSGGHTMLDFAKAGISEEDLAWFYEVLKPDRQRVIVCSLTSGGIRTDIAALSDMVAAHVSNRLDSQVHGFLGPAWLPKGVSPQCFDLDPNLQEHKNLIEAADIILTSVGYLGDPRSLMRQLIRQLLGERGDSQFIKANKDRHVSDILYNCYDGLSGENIKLPDEVANGLLSFINIDMLSDKVSKGTPCIILASGKVKSHSIIGILKRKAASTVYLDCECAKSLIEMI